MNYKINTKKKIKTGKLHVYIYIKYFTNFETSKTENVYYFQKSNTFQNLKD